MLPMYPRKKVQKVKDFCESGGLVRRLASMTEHSAIPYLEPQKST